MLQRYIQPNTPNNLHNHHNQSRKNSLTMSDVVVPTIPHLAREEESQWPGDRKVTK